MLPRPDCQNGAAMEELLFEPRSVKRSMSILVTGAAGFVGSHSAKVLAEAGISVVALDNLATGQRENARWGSFVQGDISDVGQVRHIIRGHSVQAVLHLAAFAHVGESMVRPAAYFSNNVSGTHALLEAMVSEGVRQIVFASSCSVYGNANSSRVREDEAVHPLSPYGESKLSIERALPWYERAHGMHWLALRYFNVAGSEINLAEPPSSARIIPRTIHAVLGEGPPVQLFGTRYATPDGTAVRDFVHVSDVAQANLLALRYVAAGKPGAVVNIGSGVGISVREIIDTVGSITGRPVPIREGPPQPGDAASAISDPAKARKLLGWTPSRSDLNRIVGDAVASYLHRQSAEALRASA
jgi:UDP-arabinose 4-epimerase